jgi:hypothetical protein
MSYNIKSNHLERNKIEAIIVPLRFTYHILVCKIMLMLVENAPTTSTAASAKRKQRRLVFQAKLFAAANCWPAQKKLLLILLIQLLLLQQVKSFVSVKFMCNFI